MIASRKSVLLKKYQIVACVRDVYLETPENTQIMDAKRSAYPSEHFFVYTYKGTDGVVKDVLEPCLKSGVATRIHFDDFPRGSLGNDCVYRAKNYAKWAPSLD